MGKLGICFRLLLLLTICGLCQRASAQSAQDIQRKLAPGVLTVIPIAPQEEETFTGPLPLVEVLTEYAGLDWKPNFSPKTETLLEKSKYVILRRDVWALELAFKPMRRIQIDVPQPTGKMQKKHIWYMVYRVKNIGGTLRPAPQPDEFTRTTFKTSRAVTDELRFLPNFVFAGQVLSGDEYITKEYLDRVIPAAQHPIELRETGGSPLYNTVEISKIKIPLSDDSTDNSVWGLVTWEDIDPRIDFFSIYVQGLTNAYRFADTQGGYEKGAKPGTGRSFTYKTLQLNFWRAGDSIDEHEEEIHFGVPLDTNPEQQQEYLMHYGVNKPLDSLWIYR